MSATNLAPSHWTIPLELSGARPVRGREEKRHISGEFRSYDPRRSGGGWRALKLSSVHAPKNASELWAVVQTTPRALDSAPDLSGGAFDKQPNKQAMVSYNGQLTWEGD